MKPRFIGLIRGPYLEWLPDGDRILVEAGVCLYSVASDCSHMTKLAVGIRGTDPTEYGHYVDASLDGKNVLYLTYDSVYERPSRRPVRGHEIMVVDVYSAQVGRLTDDIEDHHLPVWSLAGQGIAFLSKKIKIGRGDANDGSGRHRRTRAGRFDAESVGASGGCHRCRRTSIESVVFQQLGTGPKEVSDSERTEMQKLKDRFRLEG